MLTGGGSMLKHLNQLVKFKTGMDVRLGFPGEMLAAESADEINQPMFSTSVGLLLKGLEYYNEQKEEMTIKKPLESEDLEPEGKVEEETEAKKPLTGKIREKILGGLEIIFNEKDGNFEEK